MGGRAVLDRRQLVLRSRDSEGERCSRTPRLRPPQTESSSSTPAQCTVLNPRAGRITALAPSAVIRRYCDVSRGQIVPLAALDPIQFQSETSVHARSRNSTRENREARKRLHEAIPSGARHNSNIRAIYRRLNEEGEARQGGTDSCRSQAASHRPCHLQQRPALPWVRGG